jgi:hypothetical protein
VGERQDRDELGGLATNLELLSEQLVIVLGASLRPAVSLLAYEDVLLHAGLLGGEEEIEER